MRLCDGFIVSFSFIIYCGCTNSGRINEKVDPVSINNFIDLPGVIFTNKQGNIEWPFLVPKYPVDCSRLKILTLKNCGKFASPS